MKRLTMTVLVPSLFATLTVQAATYYIDSVGGSDGNSGTATNAAWQSVAKVNATTFAPGDAILFNSGGSWIGPLNPKGSGTAGNPIVIDRYGAGNKPLIDGNGVNGTGTTGGGAVFLYNQEHWEINNLEVVNDGASDAERRGIHIAAANFGTVDHIHIKNCYIHNIRGTLSVTDGDLVAKRTGGIIVETISDTAVPTRFNDVLIEGNTITTVRNQGIVAANNRVAANDYPLTAAWNARRASNLIIRSNTISDVTKNALILRLADETCLVEWNVCYDTATLDTGNTMFTAACSGAVFQFNEGYRNHAGPLGDHDGSLYDADLRSINITFQYSYSHDNAHGLFWQYPSASGPNTNIVVRYNISRNDRGNIFSFSGDAGGQATTYIYNNTIYLPPGSSNLICDARSGTHTYYMSNNIFYVLGAGVSYDFGSNTRVFDYNTFYGVHPASEPPDAHKLTSDPMLVAVGTGTNGISSLAGYRLQAGSPCIDSGATVAGNGGRDFFGNTVPQNSATDRGAHEFVSTVVTNPPGISQQPQNVTATNGNGAGFSVIATGTAPLAYQWRKNGAPIGGATASGLFFSAVSTNDAGGYDVVVTNIAGAVTSSVATLTVYLPPANVAPAITMHPQSQSVSAGANVTFTAAASGTAPLAFQWRKGGASIMGATNSSLALTSVTTNDAGNFDVVVTNASGSATSAAATLTVTIPVPVSGLLIAEVYNGGGKAGATYNRDYVILKNISGNGMWLGGISLQHLKAGAWQAPFAMPDEYIAPGGYYLVICYYDGGGSSGMVTTGNVATVQSSAWNFSTVTAGAVALVNGTNPVSGCDAPNIVDLVGWISAAGNCFEGAVLTNAGNATQANSRRSEGCQDTGNNANDFTLGPPTGRYSYTPPVVCNSCIAPLITASPTNLAVTAGAGADFSVSASGTSPAYQWRKDGVPIAGANLTTLSLNPASTNDAGGYDVLVSNTCGAVTSAVAVLTITADPPVILNGPQSQAVALGGPAAFSIALTGSLPMNLQWRKAGGSIPGATNLTYTISSVSSNDLGSYDVVVTNAFGTVTSSVAVLTVVPSGTNSPVNPADYINPRFANVTVTSGIKFADVFNYKGVPTSLYLDVYEPTGDTNTGRPAIVWIHGGGFRTGSSRTQSYIVTYATEFAKRGYVCFSIDYRLRSGTDMPTQESELPAEQDGAADCNTAFAWLRTNAAAYAINTNWLFVAGGSAGGRIANVFSFHEGPDTNVCVSCTSASLSNGVNQVPLVNWNRAGLIANASLWGAPEPVMRWYVLQSNDTPTVIIHGTDDATIPYQNALDLYAGLTNVAATVELNPLVGYGHTPTSANSQIIPWVANFFAQEWTKKLTPTVVPPPPPTTPTISGITLNPDRSVTLFFHGGTGETYRIVAATNLAPASWLPVSTNIADTNGNWSFTDFAPTNLPRRYYRAVTP